MGGVLDNILPIVTSAIAVATGNPELVPLVAAGTSGITKGVETGNPLSGLLAAGGSYLGSSVGGSLGGSLGNSFGGTLAETPANALGNAFGGEAVGSLAPFGTFAGNALGSDSIGSLAGSALGGSFGASQGAQLGNQLNPMSLTGAASPPGFSPSRSPQMGIPQGLSQFGSLDPFQQATNIASKGVYGGGNGSDENNYFLNLINRQLVDPSGNVNSMNSLNPVESGYLSQLGLGGYSNSNDLLQGISKYGQ